MNLFLQGVEVQLVKIKDMVLTTQTFRVRPCNWIHGKQGVVVFTTLIHPIELIWLGLQRCELVLCVTAGLRFLFKECNTSPYNLHRVILRFHASRKGEIELE